MSQQIRRIDLPQLSRLYAGAAWDGVRSRVSSAGRLKSLPAETLVAKHPGIDAVSVERYRRLFQGEAFDGVHRVSLPSVLVHTAAFPVQMALMGQEGFPLPLMGLVHLHNSVEHHAVVNQGQPLQIAARAQGLRAHRRGTQVDIIVDVLPADADPAQGQTQALWSSVSTYLSRGTYLFDKPERGDTAREAFVAPSKTGEWKLGAGTGREYAAVSGDYNPIHISALSAKALGMPRAIVHGMYAAGRMLEGREPEHAGHHWSIDFEAPMTLPATVAFSAQASDSATTEFTGWNPRKVRRHFSGKLVVPA